MTERAGDNTKYVSYELTPIPTALFKDNLMRHIEKSQLAVALVNYKKNLIEKEEKKKNRKKSEGSDRTW